jgi:hypothetical protein
MKLRRCILFIHFIKILPTFDYPIDIGYVCFIIGVPGSTPVILERSLLSIHRNHLKHAPSILRLPRKDSICMMGLLIPFCIFTDYKIYHYHYFIPSLLLTALHFVPQQRGLQVDRSINLFRCTFQHILLCF